jgi:hypothetical protein
MGRLKHLTVLFALIFSAGAVVAPSASAATQSPAGTNTTPTEITKPAWVHQCAAMHCGYHAVAAHTAAKAYCWVSHEGILWDLLTTSAPWDPAVQIVGYVSEDALSPTEDFDNCANVGLPSRSAPTTYWAHSCPLASCGYGVINAGHWMQPQFSVQSNGQTWWVVIDHSSPDYQLAGYIYPFTP